MRCAQLFPLVFALACAGGGTTENLVSAQSNGKSDGQQGDLSDVLAANYHFTVSSALSISETDDDDPAETFVLGMAGLAFNEQIDGRTKLTFRPCLVQLPEVDERVAEVEPSTVENLAEFDMSVELDLVDEQVRVRTSNGVLLAGVELTDPLGDDMPESKRDDRLVDVDDDGHPGMSLLVDGWKVYTAMRIKMLLDGRVLENGIVNGSGTLSLEFGMYGDNVPLVNAASKVEDALEKLQVDRQEHLFSLIPVSADQMGCGAVTLGTLVHSDLSREP